MQNINSKPTAQPLDLATFRARRNQNGTPATARKPAPIPVAAYGRRECAILIAALLVKLDAPTERIARATSFYRMSQEDMSQASALADYIELPELYEE